jgi:lipopolysaccharide assembly outer membrane protein LptD (OstA)
MIRFRILLVGWVLFGAGIGFSQTVLPPSAGVPVDTRITELQTAGYYELVAKAKELGLSQAGGVPELRQRIADALGLTLPAETPDKERTLTIDSAQQAGLITVDAPGEGKLLHLSGGLQVTLVDQEKKVTHVIVADELWYDQANEEMTARGQVVYTMIRESSTDVFRGDSLTFRLSDSQGVFYNGASDRPRTVGDQTMTFRYGGSAMRRSSDDLVVLDSGSITSSLGKDPNYRILAKRIWVLAPGEWGLQDAVLYLGRIPVFYFPFFFQPGDEFFFNPVLSFPGAGDRRGTSLQTTTYLWGHKKKDSSPLSFLQMEDSSTEETQRVVKGLFLVRGTPPPTNIPANWTLKYLADFYSNLGLLTGVDASLPGLWGLKTFTGTGGIGITRTVSSEGLPFSIDPFQAELDPWAQSEWNGSWIGSTRLPFRWGGQTNLDAGWGTLSLEYYSDPLLYNDMTGNRSENFSVFSLLGLGPAVTTNTTIPTPSLLWTGTLNLPPVSAAGSLLWTEETTSPAGIDSDPNNTFYAPTELILPQVTTTFQGTLWSSTASDTGDKKKKSVELLPPETDSIQKPMADEGPASSDQVLRAPALMDSLQTETLPTQWVSGVTWSFQPTTKNDIRYDPTTRVGPSDNLWEVNTSRWTGAYDGKLSLTSGLSDGSWVNNDTFQLHQQAQSTWYIEPSVGAANSAIYNQQDLQQDSSLLTQNLTSTWKPWVAGGPWRDSSLQYNLNADLWQATSYTNVFFDGKSDTVTVHNAASQAVWYLREDYPTIKAQAGWVTSLPPLDPLKTYTGRLDAAVPWGKAYTTTSAQETDTTWTFNPWESSVEWDPLPSVLLNEDYQYDLQNARPSTSTTDFQAWGFEAKYTHQRTTPYDFNSVTRQWEETGTGTPQFLPFQLLFAYTLDIPLVQWWHYRNSLSAKLNASWPINLQQYSDMPFTLNYALVYKLSRFLDLQVAEGVTNQAVFRYFPFLVNSLGPGVVSEVNPLQDLWDSLSFWDQAALRRTNFKMTNLTVGLVHYLDDWQIKLDYTGSPQLTTTGVSQYQWVSTLTLLVQWNPLPELKKQLIWDQNGTIVTPQETTTIPTQTTTSTAITTPTTP